MHKNLIERLQEASRWLEDDGRENTLKLAKAVDEACLVLSGSTVEKPEEKVARLRRELEEAKTELAKVTGLWDDPKAKNFLDLGADFFEIYNSWDNDGFEQYYSGFKMKINMWNPEDLLKSLKKASKR